MEQTPKRQVAKGVLELFGRRLLRWDARQKCRWLLAASQVQVSGAHSLLDIGSGSGLLAEELRCTGWQVEQIDVVDWAFDRARPVLLYAGARLPFCDGSFDVALLSSVLHHTGDPRQLLQEAARVAAVVILIEDVYTSRFGRLSTLLADSVANLSFRRHPHQNRTTAGWLAMAAGLGLAAVCQQERPFLLVFRQLLLVFARSAA